MELSMGMSLSKDMIRILEDPTFRRVLSKVLLSTTRNSSSASIILEMLDTYYRCYESPGDKDIFLPYGYTLHLHRRGGIYVTHGELDVEDINKELRGATPYFSLYFKEIL